jgi:hypothetical protein
MLHEGVATPEDIDRALKLGLNHPMGPFEMVDLVGLDTRLSVLQYLHQTLGERYRPSPLVSTSRQAAWAQGQPGVYDYDKPGDGLPQSDPGRGRAGLTSPCAGPGATPSTPRRCRVPPRARRSGRPGLVLIVTRARRQGSSWRGPTSAPSGRGDATTRSRPSTPAHVGGRSARSGLHRRSQQGGPGRRLELSSPATSHRRTRGVRPAKPAIGIIPGAGATQQLPASWGWAGPGSLTGARWDAGRRSSAAS